VLRSNGSAVKFFSDSVYAGRRQALCAAKRWLSMKENDIPRRTRVELMSYRRRNNRTGTSGVIRWPADGRVVSDAYWRAFWIDSPNDRRRSKRFSIATHGEQGARTKALTVRRRFLKSLTTEASIR
jgi:hypothetical protein